MRHVVWARGRERGVGRPLMSDPLEVRLQRARAALDVAKRRLGQAIVDLGPASRAEKVEVSAVVKAALSKLRAARAKIEHLEGALRVANLETARLALADAERELERAIERIAPAPRSQKAWVDAGVERAFDNMRRARLALEELASPAPGDDDA